MKATIALLLAVLSGLLLVPPPGPSPAMAQEQMTGRLAGDDRIETAAAIAVGSHPDGAETVYLARADVLADALAAGSLTDGPVVLVPRCGDVPGVVSDAIATLDPTSVVALGGSEAICDALLAELAGGRDTERIAGPSRIDTAIAIAGRSAPDGAGTVYLASGDDDAPDAVAGGTLEGGPILLTPSQGSLPAVVAAEIERLDPDQVVVLGGTAAVADPVVADLAPVSRYAGGNRVETAAEIARAGFGPLSDGGRRAATVYLAGQDRLADAVVGGALTDGPILLVPSCAALPDVVAATLMSLGPDRVIALGGAAAVCDDVLAEAASVLEHPATAPREGTVLLPADEAPLLDVTGDRLVFAATELTTSLTSGTPVVIAPDEALLPRGWGAVVTDVEIEGDRVLVAARTAGLGEVLLSGRAGLGVDGAAFQQHAEPVDVGATLAFPSCDDGTSCGVQGTVDGELTVDLDLVAAVDIGRRFAELGLTGTVEFQSNVAARVDATLTETIAEHELPSVPLPGVSILGVGAVLEPAITVDLRARMAASVDWDVAFTRSGAIGVRYADGHVSGLPAAESAPFTATFGQLDGTASYAVPITVDGTVTLGAGPFDLDDHVGLSLGAGITPSIEVEASMDDESPRATVTGAVETGGRVEGTLGPLSAEAAFFESHLYGPALLYALGPEGPGPLPEPPPPAPSPGPGAYEGDDVIMSLDGLGPDLPYLLADEVFRERMTRYLGPPTDVSELTESHCGTDVPVYRQVVEWRNLQVFFKGPSPEALEFEGFFYYVRTAEEAELWGPSLWLRSSGGVTDDTPVADIPALHPGGEHRTNIYSLDNDVAYLGFNHRPDGGPLHQVRGHTREDFCSQQ